MQHLHLTPSTPHNHNFCSIQAANRAKSIAAGQATAIYTALVRAGASGLIAQEMESLGIVGDSIRPRLKYLESEGFIQRDGTTRKTRSKRNAQIYYAIPPYLDLEQM